MALSDLAVFNDHAYSTLVEVLQERVELFNAASNGAFSLRVEAIAGDYSDTAFWTLLNGLVRRRNPYGDGPVAEKVLSQKVDTIVKVASGTPPIRMDRAWFNWIQQNPETAATAMALMMSKEVLADMLDVAIGVVTAAISNVPALVHDISANSGNDALPSPLSLSNTSIAFGDAMQSILCWIMHSKSWNDLYGNALTNNERLFSYGTVNVLQDPMGRRYIMADNPNLMLAGQSGNPAKFHTLGLTSGAVDLTQNDDFNDNWSETNGNENIHRTYQAEWSYNVGVKGFAWDKANGGHAPTNAALFAGSNWDQVVTSIKNGPGVLMVSK